MNAIAAVSVAELFPRGIAHYLAGGLLIGIATAVFYLGTAIPAGASTFLESTLSYVSRLERFTQYHTSRDWRVLFTLGIVLGAGIYAVTVSGEAFVTEVAPWRLFVGGILVGVGTRIGKGCTSGHGICGVGSVSTASLVNVGIFMTVAIGTAAVVGGVGVPT